MPGPLPGSGSVGGFTGISGPGSIIGGGKGSLRGIMPNIMGGWAGGLFGGVGAGGGGIDAIRKRRNFEPNPLGMNIYDQYPGFTPEMRGDQLGGIEKQRGGGPETLQRISEGTIRYRNRGPSFRGSVGGMGMGFGENDPIKKLLMARFGGM